MTCQTQNNVQCYSQFLEREACALWEPGTLIVLDMCWFSNEASWFDRNLQGCWASCDTFLFVLFRYLFVLFDLSTTSWVVGDLLHSWWSSRSGDYMFWKSLFRNARCASFQNLTSLILWIYFIARWTRCDFSEFSFVLFSQMPERVHKNVDWKQSPNLHSEAHSFLGSACQGESME
jgi:hypothetical protein